VLQIGGAYGQDLHTMPYWEKGPVYDVNGEDTQSRVSGEELYNYCVCAWRSKPERKYDSSKERVKCAHPKLSISREVMCKQRYSNHGKAKRESSVPHNDIRHMTMCFTG
jgi:hypothetical protein